jgi:hypothetical protein
MSAEAKLCKAVALPLGFETMSASGAADCEALPPFTAINQPC